MSGKRLATISVSIPHPGEEAIKAANRVLGGNAQANDAEILAKEIIELDRDFQEMKSQGNLFKIQR